MITLQTILHDQPIAVLNEMEKNYAHIRVPKGINTIVEMNQASVLLGELQNSYSYVMSLKSRVAAYLRMARLNVPAKPTVRATTQEIEAYNDAKGIEVALAAKKDILEDYAEKLKKDYNAVSRMVTIKMETNQEMHMSESRGGYSEQ